MSEKIGEINFNADNVTTEEVSSILTKIRKISGLIVYESGHNERYTIERID